MSGWHSLSGYLFFRAGGGISILRTKKKLWCVLEESQSQLLYFKSEDDVRHSKPPLGCIDIKGAAITLDLDNKNQFVILCDGKEYIFTAENHESMMIWLLGLQAKREKSLKNEDTASDMREKNLHRRTSDITRPAVLLPDSDNTSGSIAIDSLGRQKMQWQKYKSTKLAESLDTGIGMYRSKGQLLQKTTAVHLDTARSRSLPPVFEGMEVPRKSKPVHKQLSMSKSLDTKGVTKSAENIQQLLQYSSENYRSLNYGENGRLQFPVARNDSSSGDSDDVFGDYGPKRKIPDERRFLHRLDTIESSVDVTPSDIAELVKEAGSSSLSVSSDSAIDRGETTAPELSHRLMELEKELISTKCELAKVMNRQSGYQELLAQRDDAIRFLEGRLDTSGGTESPKSKNNSKSGSPTPSKGEKDIQERLRVLQHQNRFLNEEVKKLAKLQQTERGNFFQQEERIRALEAEIDKWKLDYVCLIRSSIRFPGGDTMDDAELILFGGDRHKIRVMKLLEGARKINPSLPTYESLSSGEVHVDVYGFKHVFEDEGLLLHYLCQELSHHFLTQAGTYEEHQRRWTHFMRQHGKTIANHYKDMKSLCRGGVPDRFRKQVWRQLVYFKVKDIVEEKGSHYFRNLCNLLPDSPLASCYRKQISLDLMRTIPSNIKFSAAGSKGIMDLQDVLLAYCVHNPTVGYCQGMNFIVGMALLFMDAQDAFWTLVAVSEKFFPSHYFDQNLIGAQSDQQVLKDILQEKLPTLYQHLEGIDIEISTVTLNWFLAIFFDAIPFQTLLRIWDCFLLEGPKVLFRFTIAILKMHEKELLQRTDTISIMRYLKASAKLCFDVEGLIKTAFEEIKPFPRRQNINSKQACYLKTLKEKNKQKELQRLAYAEREHLYMTMENENGNFMGIGSAVALGEDGKVWFCYGDQNVGKLCKVTCEEGLMYDVNISFDSRVMAMVTVSEGVVLVGTLSWMLFAYNPKTRDNLWKLQLHDAILSLCCYRDEDSMVTRTFAGLADGTLSVMEQSDIEKIVPQGDIMYIPIGQAPVSCLLLLGDQLWCASGNTVYIIHARTLDAMDNFNVSMNPYDHILAMVEGTFGIWIILRGSSILELWDPKLLNCKMLYDTRTDRYPHLRKEDDTYFNRARITAILDIGNSVWVGTGEGNLIIYEVTEHPNLKTPTDLSPSTETISSLNSSALAFGSHKKLRSGRSRASPGRDSAQFYLASPDSEQALSEIGLMTPQTPDIAVATSSNQTSTCVTSDTTSTGTVTPRVLSPQVTEVEDDSKKGKLSGDDNSSQSGHRTKVDSGNSKIENNKTVCQSSNEVMTDRQLNSANISNTGPKSVSSEVLKSNNNDSANENISKTDADSTKMTDSDLEYCTDTIRRKKKVAATKSAPIITQCAESEQKKTQQDMSDKSNNGKPKVERNDSACIMNTSTETAEMFQDAKQVEICSECKESEKTVCNHHGDSMSLSLNDVNPNLTMNKVMSRHHKVNNWLSSLKEGTNNEDQVHTVISEGDCSTSDLGTEPDSVNDIHLADTAKNSNLAKQNKVQRSSEVTPSVKKQGGSDATDDVFYEAPENTSDHSGDQNKQKGSPQSDKSKQSSKGQANDETSSSKSEDAFESCQNSSEQNVYDDTVSVGFSEAETDCLQKQVSMHENPEIKYRLDFSGMHVETDNESEQGKKCLISDSLSELSLFNSRNNSIDGLAYPFANGKLCEAELAKMETWSLTMSRAPSITSTTEPRLLEHMQTHSLISRKLSLCRMSRDFVDWNEMCSNGKHSSGSPHSSSLDHRLAEFLRTPSISSRPSSLWSSYENISTPTVEDNDSGGRVRRYGAMNIISNSASTASFNSNATDMCYSTDLVLQVKVKIADRPVRTFLKTSFESSNEPCDKGHSDSDMTQYRLVSDPTQRIYRSSCNEPIIMSFSGCQGDDESVLKWRREPNERLWTNEPIVEICPKTKLTRLPSYMRNRLSSNSSHNSQGSTVSGFSFQSQH